MPLWDQLEVENFHKSQSVVLYMVIAILYVTVGVEYLHHYTVQENHKCNKFKI